MIIHNHSIPEQLKVPFQKISSHARFILATKIALSLLAAVLVVLLIVLPITHPAEKHYKLSVNAEKSDTPSITRMTAPRYQGIDTKNQPYNVTAESATQPSIDTVMLNKPTADITLTDGRWLSVLANKGEFTISEKRLVLTGRVNLFLSDGYELRTESAIVDMENSTAAGNQKIIIQSNPMTLSASGFTVTNQGNNINFTGTVHVTLYPNKN